MNLDNVKKHNIKVSGDDSFRGDCPLESAEQVSFLAILKTEYPDLAAIAVHVRNEGKRTKHQAHRQKQEGLNTGASDIIIPCSPPIVIELKRRDHTKSSISAKQIAYLARAQRLGARACVALGASAAIDFIRECMKDV